MFRKAFIVLCISALVANCQDIFEDGQEFAPIAEVFDDFNVTAANACTVDIHTQTGSPQPVFIRPGTSQFFHPANRQGQMQFAANQAIELWCSGAWASPGGAPNLITATCVSGQTFRFNNANFNFNSFRCQAWPTFTTRRSTARCFNNAIFVDVGFQVGNRWLQVFRSCHDLALETNWFTQYTFTPISDANQRNVERPRFIQTDFFPGRTVDNLYVRNVQRNTISAILSDQAAANRFIEAEPSDIFLARGHIAAMTDFILGTEQQATFHFINTAPQWQTFNSLNWVSVEISSRRLAADRNIHLDVFTGTFGNGRLWTTAGARRQIFLDWPAARIPMPMIYYKILVNRAAQTGVVLIGVNNPHLTLAEIYRDGYVVCTDVSSRINYVSWQRTNLRRGYSYACEVNDFLARVPHVTGLNVRGLLV